MKLTNPMTAAWSKRKVDLQEKGSKEGRKEGSVMVMELLLQ
jgi:hypothetical protein